MAGTSQDFSNIPGGGMWLNCYMPGSNTFNNNFAPPRYVGQKSNDFGMMNESIASIRDNENKIFMNK